MDGLQIQWLLAPDEVDLAEASAFAIDAIVAAVVGRRRRTVVDAEVNGSRRPARRVSAPREG